jgi:type I restriction enzyme M protein
MLFLKRCSDVFDAEREKIVGAKVEQGMVREKAETEYGENPDFYDGFFCPGTCTLDLPSRQAGRC